MSRKLDKCITRDEQLWLKNYFNLIGSGNPFDSIEIATKKVQEQFVCWRRRSWSDVTYVTLLRWLLLIQNVCNVCPHLSLDTIKSPRDSQYIDRSENVKGNRRQNLPEGQKVRPQWKKSPHKPIEHAIRTSICDLVKYTITGTFPFSFITTFVIPCQPFMSYPRKEGRIKNGKF